MLLQFSVVNKKQKEKQVVGLSVVKLNFYDFMLKLIASYILNNYFIILVIHYQVGHTHKTIS